MRYQTVESVKDLKFEPRQARCEGRPLKALNYNVTAVTAQVDAL